MILMIGFYLMYLKAGIALFSVKILVPSIVSGTLRCSRLIYNYKPRE